MKSSKSGNYYKRKTKLFLEKEGYIVEYIEKMQVFPDRKTGKMIYVKRDLFGADLLAIGNNKIIFANVTTKNNVSSHKKTFTGLPFPSCIHLELWVVTWEPGAKAPDIHEVLI